MRQKKQSHAKHKLCEAHLEGLILGWTVVCFPGEYIFSALINNNLVITVAVSSPKFDLMISNTHN